MDSKGIKVVTHASTFFAPIIVPLLVWLLIKDQEVKNLAMEALIFHILMGISIWVFTLLSFILIGIPFLIVAGIVAIYYPIKGIFYALRDRRFHYPFIGSFVR
ncbi:DUF4870 domain-containing protein [Brevibacillus ginsengisoli]|uniref:DUF4870 domain-containing protein n=1 Tax=Brevibacillus ginsengisoli TaxID=363854 RepID=UPI003CF6369C